MRLWRTALAARGFAGLATLVAVCGMLGACAVGGSRSEIGATGSLPQAGPTTDSVKSARAGTVQPKRTDAKVAMLLPLSANPQVAAVARALKQAGEMALLENNAGDFQLLVKDDKGTPDGARAAAEEAIKEGAELILGPLLSASVQAVAPVARAANVSVIAFSNDRQAALLTRYRCRNDQ